MLEFETNVLGKLKILALINDIALLEKQYNTPEKYIIAYGFNAKEKRWNKGSYCTSFDDALEEFKKAVSL